MFQSQTLLNKLNVFIGVFKPRIPVDGDIEVLLKRRLIYVRLQRETSQKKVIFKHVTAVK